VLRRGSIAGVLIFGLLAGGLPLTAQPAAEDAAVREVVRKYVEARERADANAIGALFTSDADQLTSSGEWRKGREAIVKGTLASSKQNSGTRTIAIETVRFPTIDTAIADGRYAISGGAGGDRRMWTSFVLARTTQDGKATWQIAAIRNMLPAPAQ
jgi:uncharacterized protein (TIGR02246 family)